MTRVSSTVAASMPPTLVLTSARTVRMRTARSDMSPAGSSARPASAYVMLWRLKPSWREASAAMACSAARRVGGMSAVEEMVLASCGRAAAGSRNASSSMAARSPVCVPTQAAWAGGNTQATSASRQPTRRRTFLVFGRITARSLRAHAAVRSALFY